MDNQMVAKLSAQKRMTEAMQEKTTEIVDVPIRSMAARTKILHLQVENIRDRLRGEGDNEANQTHSLTTLDAILGCLRSTNDLAADAFEQLRILGDHDVRSAEKDIRPEAENSIYSLACDIARKLMDIHSYLTNNVPGIPPAPEDPSIVDRILDRMAYSEVLVDSIRNAIDELIG
jgi:hypothetical protein